jgi:hypothetical protein
MQSSVSNFVDSWIVPLIRVRFCPTVHKKPPHSGRQQMEQEGKISFVAGINANLQTGFKAIKPESFHLVA